MRSPLKVWLLLLSIICLFSLGALNVFCLWYGTFSVWCDFVFLLLSLLRLFGLPKYFSLVLESTRHYFFKCCLCTSLFYILYDAAGWKWIRPPNLILTLSLSYFPFLCLLYMLSNFFSSNFFNCGEFAFKFVHCIFKFHFMLLIFQSSLIFKSAFFSLFSRFKKFLFKYSEHRPSIVYV